MYITKLCSYIDLSQLWFNVDVVIVDHGFAVLYFRFTLLDC